MKTIIVNIVLCAMLCTVVACDSWLDTTPPSQVPEEDQFGDEFGFRQALIGCYIGMANENLYGKQRAVHASFAGTGVCHGHLPVYGSTFVDGA